MTTARITSLSPQVYASTLRNAKETVAARQSAHRPQADASSAPSSTASAGASQASGGAAKPAGVGRVVDMIA